MDWLACLFMAAILLVIAYIVAAMVIAVSMAISRGRWCHYLEILRTTANDFSLVMLLLGVHLVVAVYVSAYPFTLIGYLFCVVAASWFCLWCFRSVAKTRVCARLLAVVIGCLVSWLAYASVLTPIRLDMVKDLLGRRFDERLANTICYCGCYSDMHEAELGDWRRTWHLKTWHLNRYIRSDWRDVMRKVVSDDWRLQLICGDIPVDWLIDAVGDMERRIRDDIDKKSIKSGWKDEKTWGRAKWKRMDDILTAE